MNRILFLPLAASVLAGADMPDNLSVRSDTDRKGQKNVLFIAVDDLKPLLGCYGDKFARTPNIDRLAAQSTVFTSAYCQQAVSAATRASLLTGWCPDRTKVWDLKTMIRDKNPDALTIPQYFISQGYTVAGVGKIYDPRSVDKAQDTLSWSVPYIDFDDFYNPDYEQPVMSFYQSGQVRSRYEEVCREAVSKGIVKPYEFNEYVRKFVKPAVESADVPDDAYSDGAIAAGAVRFLQDYDGNAPYFLAVGFKKPHLPFCAPEKYWKLYDRNSVPLANFRKKAANSPDIAYHKCGELRSYTDIPEFVTLSDSCNLILPDDKARELIHGYYAAVSYMDAQVGKVLDEMEKRGDMDNTVIVLWGDHGWHLGDHGLWNKHTNFEEAVRVPYIIFHPGSKPGETAAPVEFLSIFPTICELAGVSVPAGLDGESLAETVIAGEVPSKPYAVSQYPRGKIMGYSLRTERYRYTVWVDWKDKKSDFSKVVAEELYDYHADPEETVNWINDPSYRDALEVMRGYWEEFKSTRGRINGR